MACDGVDALRDDFLLGCLRSWMVADLPIWCCEVDATGDEAYYCLASLCFTDDVGFGDCYN